jgi:hypothetical protein
MSFRLRYLFCLCVCVTVLQKDSQLAQLLTSPPMPSPAKTTPFAEPRIRSNSLGPAAAAAYAAASDVISPPAASPPLPSPTITTPFILPERYGALTHPHLFDSRAPSNSHTYLAHSACKEGEEVPHLCYLTIAANVRSLLGLFLVGVDSLSPEALQTHRRRAQLPS